MYDWSKIHSETKLLLGDKNLSFEDFLNKNNDVDKVESFKSEMFAATIFKELSKIKPYSISLVEQLGSNHPDIKLKINNKITHIEITRISSQDNRFKSKITKRKAFNANNQEHQIELDFTKVMIISKITEKCIQYSKWIKKGIIHKDDAKIIGIDLGEIFPVTASAPVLFSAYNMLKDSFDILTDKHSDRAEVSLISPRESIVKINMKGEGVIIHQDILLDAITNSHINGIFAFTRFGLPTYLQVISINSNELMNCLYEYYFLRSLKYNVQASMLRHEFLR